MNRPIQITIIGILFIIGGFLAGWSIIYGLFNNHLNFNFAALMAPVGFGLLKGRASSRGWAKFWISLFSLVIGGLLIFYPFFGDSYSVAWFDRELTGIQRHATAIGIPVIFLLIAGWMWRSLSMPSAVPFFDDYENAEAQQVASSNH